MQGSATRLVHRANNAIIQAWPYLGRAQCYVNRAYCWGEGSVLHSCPCPSTWQSSVQKGDEDSRAVSGSGDFRVCEYVASLQELFYESSCCCFEMDHLHHLSGLRGLHRSAWETRFLYTATMSEALLESSGEAGSFPLSSTQPIKLKPQSASGSPCGSPRMSPRSSPRNSPRHSPLLFRKLLMNRSIALQRRFTLAHTPR